MADQCGVAEPPNSAARRAGNAFDRERTVGRRKEIRHQAASAGPSDRGHRQAGPTMLRGRTPVRARPRLCLIEQRRFERSELRSGGSKKTAAAFCSSPGETRSMPGRGAWCVAEPHGREGWRSKPRCCSTEPEEQKSRQTTIRNSARLYTFTVQR